LAPPPSCRRASRNSPRRERIELRAFGCLLEELAGHCPPAPGVALAQLARRCLAPDPAARPPFAEVEEALAGLKGRVQATPQIDRPFAASGNKHSKGNLCAVSFAERRSCWISRRSRPSSDWGRRLGGREADRPAAAYRAAGSRPAYPDSGSSYLESGWPDTPAM
jgi:hypothetical protein